AGGALLVGVTHGHPQVLGRGAPTQTSAHSSSRRDRVSPRWLRSWRRAVRRTRCSLNGSCSSDGRGPGPAPHTAPSPFSPHPPAGGTENPLGKVRRLTVHPAGKHP